MSIKNKSKDSNQYGQINRKFTGPNNGWHPRACPKSWCRTYNNIPKRRANKAICRKILIAKCYDSIPLPLGNKKPHTYYW